jgi:hypothetical protein
MEKRIDANFPLKVGEGADMFAALLCLVAALTPQDTQISVREELASYYQTSKMPGSWDASLKNVASANGEDRRKAAAHLVELMEQSWQDEKSGKAPWLATPYWGGPMENPARNLRGSIVAALKETPPAPETLPVIQWLLRNEPQMRLQETVAGVLGKINGKAADDYRRELVLEPHPNAIVMGMVLAQLGQRKVAVPLDRLKDLCHHHRQLIRDNARKLNQALNGPDPGPFDPIQAFKSPAVRKTFDDLQALLIDLPAKDADFVELTIRYVEKDEVKRSDKVLGWLLKQDKNEVTIYSPYGGHNTYRDKEKTKIRVGKPIEGGYQSWEIEVTTSVTVAKHGIAGYVKEIADIRAEGNKDFGLSPRGALTGQFQGQGASLPEVILTAWLDRAGKPDIAASILLPALDTLYEDRHIVEMARHRMGDLFGHRMLIAFVGDRDYEQALKLARTLAQHYPATQFYEYAKRLAAELPRRRDDFATLKLPTPMEWQELKKQLSRAEQIDYLCQRMHLINFDTWGKQYAEPLGMDNNAARSLREGKTALINPLTELNGPWNFQPQIEDNTRPKGMDLTLKDVPQLSKYLKDNWFILVVYYWRDFHPNRDLSNTRDEFASVINKIARRDVCKIADWEKRAPAEIDQEIERINRWAVANAHKSKVELTLDALDESMAAGVSWRNMSEYVEWLLNEKERRAYKAMQRILELDNTPASDKAQVLQTYIQYDPSQAKDLAPKYLDHKEESVRFRAALIAFQTGEKVKSPEVLGELLENWGPAYLSKMAVELLLQNGSEPSRRQVLRIFKCKNLSSVSNERAAIMGMCAKSGMVEPYKYYLKQLDNNERTANWQDGEGKFISPTFAAMHASEIINWFASEDAAVKEIGEKYKNATDQIPCLKNWLQSRIAAKKG